MPGNLAPSVGGERERAHCERTSECRSRGGAASPFFQFYLRRIDVCVASGQCCVRSLATIYLATKAKGKSSIRGYTFLSLELEKLEEGGERIEKRIYSVAIRTVYFAQLRSPRETTPLLFVALHWPFVDPFFREDNGAGAL